MFKEEGRLNIFKVWIRIIAVLEIIGGIFGTGSVVLQIATGQNDRLSLVIASITFAVYLLSLISGVALLLNHRFGRIGSIVVQCIQLPKYGSQLIVFMFSFGFDAYLYFGLNSTANILMGFEFKFLAFNQLFVNVAGTPVIFGISIPASIFLAMLLKYKPPLASANDAFTRDE